MDVDSLTCCLARYQPGPHPLELSWQWATHQQWGRGLRWDRKGLLFSLVRRRAGPGCRTGSGAQRMLDVQGACFLVCRTIVAAPAASSASMSGAVPRFVRGQERDSEACRAQVRCAAWLLLRLWLGWSCNKRSCDSIGTGKGADSTSGACRCPAEGPRQSSAACTADAPWDSAVATRAGRPRERKGVQFMADACLAVIKRLAKLVCCS